LVALEQELFTNQLFAGHLLRRASFRRFLAAPGPTLIIAEVGGQLAGYVLVLYRSNSGLARMYSIGVAAHFRRHGLARTLLAEAQEEAIKRGRTAMRLEVRADDPIAIALYKTSGYHSFGRRTGYYDGRIDALRFEKTLGGEPRSRRRVTR
jgi:ribosomal-protein-alanine N-acetyltransferase